MATACSSPNPPRPNKAAAWAMGPCRKSASGTRSGEPLALRFLENGAVAPGLGARARPLACGVLLFSTPLGSGAVGCAPRPTWEFHRPLAAFFRIAPRGREAVHPRRARSPGPCAAAPLCKCANARRSASGRLGVLEFEHQGRLDLVETVDDIGVVLKIGVFFRAFAGLEDQRHLLEALPCF